jgi:hypothetical protein
MDYKFKKILIFIFLLITIYSKSLLNNKIQNYKKIISNNILTNKMNLISFAKNKIYNSIIFFPKTKIYLNVYEFEMNTTRYLLTQLNKDVEYYEDQFAFIAQIQSEDNYTMIENLSYNYNHFWIFYTDQPNLIEYILEKTKSMNKNKYTHRLFYYNFAIIFPENISYPKNKSEKNIPLFTIPLDAIENFTNYDYNLGDKRINFILKTENIIYEYPINYMIFISIVFISIGIFFVIFYNIRLKYNEQDTLTIQKLFILIIYSNLLNSISIFICCLNLKGKDPNAKEEEDTSTITISTFLTLFDSFFRVFLWSFILLISMGLQITKAFFNRNEIKLVIKLIILFYVVCTFEQLMNEIDTKTVFKGSEIKNIIFYSFLIYFLYIKIKKNIEILKRKIQYCLFFSREYISALVLKLNMMKDLLMCLICFYIMYILLIFIHKIFFLKYNTDYFLIFQYHYLDTLLMIAFLVIFRPRQFPEFFNANFGDDTGTFPNVYQIKNKNLKKLCDKNVNFGFEKKATEKDLKNSMKKNIPLIILNPIDIKKFEKKDINLNEDENDINVIIENVNLGFIENNKKNVKKKKKNNQNNNNQNNNNQNNNNQNNNNQNNNNNNVMDEDLINLILGIQ